MIIAGGLVRNADGGVVGTTTVDFIGQFRVDLAIIGISGIDFDGALLDFDHREVRVAQTILDNARRVFLVADHTKFGPQRHGPAGRDGTGRRPVHRPASAAGTLAPVLRDAGVEVHVARVGHGVGRAAG